MPNLVDRVAVQIKTQFLTESAGHDWHHINRVWHLIAYRPWGSQTS